MGEQLKLIKKWAKSPIGQLKKINSNELMKPKDKKDAAAEQRRHHIHFQLKKTGISIDPEKKSISLSAEMEAKLTKNQKGWIDELKNRFKYDTQSAIHINPIIKSESIMEQNKTNFFSAILPYLEHAGMRIVIDNEDGKLSVSILPQTKKANAPFRITPFNAQGTAAEMDEGLLPQLATAYEKLNEAGLKTNAEDFAEGVEVREKPKAKKAPAAAKPSGKKAATKKGVVKKAEAPKETVKQKVETAIGAGSIKKAQDLVDKANKGGGLPKDEVAKLQALVDKAIADSYYSEPEQKQLKTRLDSMRSDLEKEEAGLITLTQAQPDNKQYAQMLKVPREKLKKVNEAMKQLEEKKLGLKGKKLIPIAQLVKNPIA
jgi:PRTRC genetic system protein E